jgi:hypothetical protein
MCCCNLNFAEREFAITGSTIGQIKENYKPEKWDLSEIQQSSDSLEEMWARVTPFKAIIKKERDLHAPLRSLLEMMGCSGILWEGDDNEHKSGACYPDFVIQR